MATYTCCCQDSVFFFLLSACILLYEYQEPKMAEEVWFGLLK